jgi:thiamine-phosphate pyrophosphorylase
MNQYFRILDANFNRAREAFRVLEDYARFMMDDDGLSQQAKNLRHDLCQTTAQLPPLELLAARDTPNDVGTTLTTPTENHREGPGHVAVAAAKRLTEALRCLEEYSKISCPLISQQFEAIRYRCYELEKRFFLRAGHRSRLKDICLYVLLTKDLCRFPLLETAQAALDGGADCLQLREKDMVNSQLIELAILIADLCHKKNAIFILNDRIDLALLGGADGVHLGQNDLSIPQARKIAGSQLIIGKSTHNEVEASQAVEHDADYLAVGSIFTSPTKPEIAPAGLELIRQIRPLTSRPIIAIGGIDETNAHSPIQAGADAVAVCQAVSTSENPQKTAQILKTAVLNAKTSRSNGGLI